MVHRNEILKLCVFLFVCCSRCVRLCFMFEWLSSYLWGKAPGFDSLVCVTGINLFLSSCIPPDLNSAQDVCPGPGWFCLYMGFLHAFIWNICVCVCMFLYMCVFSRLYVNMQGRTWDDTVNLSTKHSSYFLLLISCSLVFMGLFTCNTVKYIYNIWPKGHSYCFGLEWVWFILIVEN